MARNIITGLDIGSSSGRAIVVERKKDQSFLLFSPPWVFLGGGRKYVQRIVLFSLNDNSPHRRAADIKAGYDIASHIMQYYIITLLFRPFFCRVLNRIGARGNG